MVWLFWLLVAAPVYASAGYPLAWLLLRLVIRRPVSRRPVEPFVSLLIPAYNEARTIARKIRDSPGLSYPADKLEIVAVCDGSYDGIVVSSDAPATLYADEVAIGKYEDSYWKYETFLKVRESRLSSTLGAHGHLHAIRKEVYPHPAPGTIHDGSVIPELVLAEGFRAVYDPEAIVYEEAQEMTGFGRRIRIVVGALAMVGALAAAVQRGSYGPGCWRCLTTSR